MSIERRVHARENVDYPCWLRTDNAGHLIEGQVNNISQGGAKLSLRTPAVLPDRLDMFMTRDGKVARHCRVVWRSGQQIGLEFVARTAAPPPPAETVERFEI